MAWVRLHDGAMQNMKVANLSDSAFRLWVRGLCYCQTALTDGLIPHSALRDMGAKRKDVDELAAPQVEGHPPLWERIDQFGFKVHDYLDWNDSREAVKNRQRLASHRKAFMDDPDLKRLLRDRDGDLCRYCGREVNWSDRKSAGGATYDHIDPKGDASLSNLVVACRGCNSSKRNRTPEEAGMPLRPPRIKSQITDPITDPITRAGFGLVKSTDLTSIQNAERESEGKPRGSGSRRGRIFLHRWQLDTLIDTLGAHAVDFGLDDWLDALNQRIAGKALPPDPWKFVKGELDAEIRRRGLAVVEPVAPPTNKRIAGLMAGGEAFLRRVADQKAREGA